MSRQAALHSGFGLQAVDIVQGLLSYYGIIITLGSIELGSLGK